MSVFDLSAFFVVFSLPVCMRNVHNNGIPEIDISKSNSRDQKVVEYAITFLDILHIGDILYHHYDYSHYTDSDY